MNRLRFMGKLGLLILALAAPLGLSAQGDTTFVAQGNPLFKYKYTADPGALVHGDKVYISNDHGRSKPSAIILFAYKMVLRHFRCSFIPIHILQIHPFTS
ncbi:hypothetical protein [Bacteroides graminisolvens]|uniref:hypothetical protein n=1 Tax=Bacteroides graminisolvens TaxID=477666 RepID=UPI0038992E23